MTPDRIGSLDVLGERQREEFWLGRLADRNEAAPRPAGMDALLTELRAAFDLRRRLTARLATEGELSELTGATVAMPWEDDGWEQQRKAG